MDNRDLVRASIERIIATNTAERLMRPNYGSRLKHLLFEPLDEFLMEDFKEELKDILQNQEPRIVVTAVDFSADVETMTVNVSINFKYTNSNISDNYAFVIDYNQD